MGGYIGKNPNSLKDIKMFIERKEKNSHNKKIVVSAVFEIGINSVSL